MQIHNFFTDKKYKSKTVNIPLHGQSRISSKQLNFTPMERKYTDNVHKLPEPTNKNESVLQVLQDFGKKHQTELISGIAILFITIVIVN